MSIRGKELYISDVTARRLFWLQKVEKNHTDDQGFILTIDAIADRLLNEKIEEEYPNILQLEKRMKALDEQMIIELEQNKKRKEK